MGIKVSIYGADKDSDEYNAALKMKSIIQNSVPDSVIGEIILFVSATLFGQAVKDIDLMMMGNLNNYSVNAEFNASEKDGVLQNTVNDKVDVRSFCTVIEVKSHDISGIVRNGTDFYVKYGNRLHCVTLQSNKQKIAAKSFFEKSLSFSPFITNIIWFTQVTADDVTGLLEIGGGRLPSNVVGKDFEFRELMQLLIWQKPPFRTRSGFVFESNYESCTVNDFQKALMLFSHTKKQMGELTRKRIEMITSKTFRDNALVDANGKVSIYRGRAGTGKTVGLIQTAIRLVDEEQARVIILTYNRALVSDIRRLFALAELPDMFEENCVYVSTMHAYFFHMANNILYDGQMSGTKFLDHYEAVLKEMNDFLSDDVVIGLAHEMIMSDERLNWDYVLIDEAQDWTNVERDLILKLFEKGKIIAADGGNQFVRRGEVCDWNVIRERNNIKLKYCLRQKENIVSFLNTYSNKAEILGGKILCSEKMPGGKVVIISDDRIIEIHKMEMKKLVDAGNIAYDMLYLVPHSLVEKSYGVSRFSMIKDFEQEGIFLWDGTNSDNRDGYCVNTDEVRVLQYDSARGLEGWVVVCMDFDVFMEEKEAEYIDGEVNSLLLESPEERKKKYLYNWAMIPLTRAIDTLVITLKNPQSKIASFIREVADVCKDYVMWMS